MHKKILLTSFFILLTIAIPLFSQIKIVEVPHEGITTLDSLYLNLGEDRKIINFDSGWQVFTDVNSAKRTTVNIPCYLSGTENIYFEKEFDLDKETFAGKRKVFHFIGLNYSAEIILNGVVLYKHPGGTLPFHVEVNEEALNDDGVNKLRVVLNHELSAVNTIPVKHRFLFPESYGGIVRDVFMSIGSPVFIRDKNLTYSIGENLKNVDVKLNFDISTISENEIGNGYTVVTEIFDRFNNPVRTVKTESFTISEVANKSVSVNFTLSNVALWSPGDPVNYTFKSALIKDDVKRDEQIYRRGFYKIDQSGKTLLLNGTGIELNGVTYVPFDKKYKSLLSRKQLKDELKLIKIMGMNAVRFPKDFPHPYIIEMCDELGLFTFLDLPINSVPEELCQEANFKIRANEKLTALVDYYKNNTSVLAVGLGAGYLPQSQIHKGFISALNDKVKSNSDILTFAGYSGVPTDVVTDFTGLEIFAQDIKKVSAKIEKAEEVISPSRLLLGEVTYPTYNGSTDGYLNEYSLEAQAKYFSDILGVCKKRDVSGYFINSLYDYEGPHTSLFAAYDENNVYNIGILGLDKGTNRLAYKVIKSKLNNGEKVTIPIGSKKDDAPFYFIIVGLVLAIIPALLINSNRKFREDANRALFRPYNFFADIRDHRILSGFHSNMLMLTISGVHSLLLTNLLFFLRNSILFEKILISFGSKTLVDVISYLAWNPLYSLGYLFVFSIILFFVITLFFKIASQFIRTKVLMANIYYVVIWAYLPLVVMIFFELVLYRVLVWGEANEYIFGFLGFLFLWLTQRLIKGIYVIFDVRPELVYISTFFFTLVMGALVFVYFHFTEFTTFYVINSVKQFMSY